MKLREKLTEIRQNHTITTTARATVTIHILNLSAFLSTIDYVILSKLQKEL